MLSSLKNVVVIGAGGRIGSIILQGLLEAPELNVTAIKRPTSTATLPEASNLRVVESEYTLESLVSAFKGQDVVISVIGGMGIGSQKVLVDAALQAGVKRFFPSEFGINGQSKAVKAMTPWFAPKDELVDYLVEKEKEGLTWTGVICGFLFDWCLSNGFLGFDLAAKKALIWDDGNNRFSATRDADLRKGVVEILRHEAETANKFVYISSIGITQKEVLQALEKSTSSKYDVTYKSTQEQLDQAKEALSKGEFVGALVTTKGTCMSNLPGLEQHYEVDVKDKLDNQLLGIQKANVQEVVDEVLASGKYDGSNFL